MKQDVKLYIDNRLVDFSEELSMPFTYQLKDINNPTVVKNAFTKTIDIIGTEANNNIFGGIYNLDREQLFDANKLVGAYFNPSIRTPFTIYRNGELIESGYMQLNGVTIKHKLVNYNITLYGGLGDFFYSLMYSDESEPLILSDLVYDVKDEDGNPYEDSDREMDFNINKEFVYSAFQRVGMDNGGTIYDYITFIPSYNGLPENFDSDKVLINTWNNRYLTPTLTKEANGNTYEPYNNYILGTLPRKYTEWEMLDLRSYLQRPAIKMSKIIEACCNPINNGGYTVELDTDFFNDNNPYYKDAWVALPLLTNMEKEKNNITNSDGRLVYQNLKIGDIDLGGGFIMTAKESADYLVPTSDFTVVNNTNIDYGNIPVGTLTNVEVEFDLNFITDNNVNDSLYLSYMEVKANNNEHSDSPVVFVRRKSAVLVQLIARDGDTNEIVGFTDILSFSSKIPIDIDITNNIAKYWWKDYTSETEANITTVNGIFKNVDGSYKFNVDGKQRFTIALNSIIYCKKLKLEFNIKRVIDNAGTYGYGDLSNSNSYGNNYGATMVNGYFEPRINKITISRDEPDSVIASNSIITKQHILKTEKTPADYLLGYCKMFDLHFSKVNGEKIIKLQTRNNFYNGNIIDWTDRIDWSKDFKIKPICFDKKFYQMGLEGESYYLTKYKNEYSVDYGQKRINTNYNFNAETAKLYEDNVFQNAISVIDTSPYYHTFIDKDDRILAPFCNANFNYNLFDVDGSGMIESSELTYETPSISNGWSWNRHSGYDSFAKTCFYKLENDEKSLNDISSVLLFYNGQVEPEDFDGNSIKYKLTDDMAEMYVLNNKMPCWLFTDFDYIIDGSIIAMTLPSIPQFLRYKIIGNQVQASWDFGKPKESYIPNITYEDNTTLYNQYWESYYNDTLNINTKEVECYMNLNDINVNGDILKNFYYFNGCYWVLNKIDNYNINKFETTKCTFVKVNELSNYKNNIGEVETIEPTVVEEEIGEA